ncbi:hypothetical protein B0O99DRAFT_109926 [Bisporella sp. PMI_857]|nr:hypothetical protein B0O99DRAFT_109926 [Bisporella sp. PMI_857]
MIPAVCKSVLGIRFSKKHLNELRRVWNDNAWDDVYEDLENAYERESSGYWEGDEDIGNDEKDEEDEEDEESDDDEYDEDADEEDDGREEEDAIADTDGGAEDDFINQPHEDDDEKRWVPDRSEQQYISDTTIPAIDKLAELVFRLCIFFIYSTGWGYEA